MRYSIGAKGKSLYVSGMKHLVRMYSLSEWERQRCAPDKVREIDAERTICLDKCNTAIESKVIVFDSKQIKVFWELILSNKFLPSVDYKLPFPDVWIQFTSNVILNDVGTEFVHDLGNTALLLTQQESGFNRIIMVHEEHDDEEIIWNLRTPEKMTVSQLYTEMTTAEQYRMLAAACIAYINCENIYLHKEGEVSDAINAKRERKGKSRLEPYYVCRIRGVQYDSEGYEKGAGVKHGIRYDVRGHFRRLETGKTIWVRPHQRGLQNELYVPKTYVVAKEPHQ